MQDTGKRWHLQLMERGYPDLDNIATLPFPVAYDEETGCFFPEPPTSGEVLHIPARRQLDGEFYLREFMDLDPEDTEELTEFMGTYGLLTSMWRTPLQPRLVLGGTIATPTVGVDRDGRREGFPLVHEEDMERANRAEESLNSRYGGIIATARLLLSHSSYLFVPREEAIGSAKELQGLISELVTLKKDGLPAALLDFKETGTYRRIAQISNALSPYYPLCQLAMRGEASPGSVAPRTFPLTIAILSQLVAGLQAEEGYRECPECHCIFMYKRNRNGFSSRDPRAKYCSDACQRTANHRKDRRRNHAKRTEEEGRK